MIVAHEKELKAKVLESDAVKNAAMKVLVSPEEGWDSHVMRVIELGAGGFSPRHEHPWPHINYMIEGKGTLHLNGEDIAVEAGSYAFVPPNTPHQFQNTGEEAFRFICIVPKEGHQ